ncbi:MAG: phosphoenolpyruvate carboxykinase (ATP) [Bacteroidales bacterium]|nr:phosphoenolpyruvate carboxykinase (ATP) [Bacteroidales bacterium]
MKELQSKLQDVIKSHQQAFVNVKRSEFIREAVANKECIVSANGALATWTPSESTGRSPKDTVVVKRAASEGNIDWTSPNNLPITEETFDMLFQDGLDYLASKKKIYVTDRVIGADSSYALPVKVASTHALAQVFADNMFRPVPADIASSIYAEKGFYLVHVPYEKLNPERYNGRLRQMPNGKASDLVVAMDFDRGLGVIIGSAYMGSMKKMLFTVMNYLLPLEGILPLHCSANEGSDGKSALLLGLSGTGKTTLSADPTRALLGDDEHGWSEEGIANFENGCYAKMIDINPKKEPDIFEAVMHNDDYLNHGSIIENAMIYPNGEFDYYDDRYTPNSRASYPLSYLKNIKVSSVAGHPTTILFLTADATGVLPPVSKLSPNQAMLWFLMGYTSKLAGTETGVKEPQATFSRFFGQPFMPSKPEVYAKMLGEKMEKHNVSVYLINTGWSGGAYGVGSRIDLPFTRAMVNAALNGDLNHVEYVKDELFHVNVPTSVPGVPTEILNPSNTWKDKAEYTAAAKKLAKQFSDSFDKSYGSQGIDPIIIKECPGK